MANLEAALPNHESYRPGTVTTRTRVFTHRSRQDKIEKFEMATPKNTTYSFLFSPFSSFFLFFSFFLLFFHHGCRKLLPARRVLTPTSGAR